MRPDDKRLHKPVLIRTCIDCGDTFKTKSHRQKRCGAEPDEGCRGRAARALSGARRRKGRGFVYHHKYEED